MITCKSPLTVMRAAWELGQKLFDERSHKFSRRDFTLPQLFACLALREHQKKSYRGVEALLADCPEWRAAVGMTGTPDHNTPCRAFTRLVKSRSMNRALDLQVEQAEADGLDVRGDAAKPSALDATCFESHHVSRHFERRREETAQRAAATAAPPATAKQAGKPRAPAQRAGDLKRSRTVRGLPKLSIVVAASCHLILAARATTGMGSDHPHFAPLVADAKRRADVAVVVADAGYDSEENHRVGQDQIGVATVIPPSIGRPSAKPPAGPRRRTMRERLADDAATRDTYGERWQVETVNSMVKRNPSSACRARTPRRRSLELLLRCVTHNIMVLEGTEP